jgi:hypothetical protein
MILATIRKSGALATLYQALIINDVLGFGGIFVLHVFRYDLAGKICAGDYSDEAEISYPHSGEYLISQGRFLQGLVIFVWIGGIILFSLSVCLMLCHHKSIASAIKNKITNAYDTLSFVERLGRGNQNDLLNYQFLYSAASSLAVAVAVATYLWSKEVNETCLSLEFSNGPSDIISVHDRFKTVLKMWFTFAVVDFFRSMLALVAISQKSKWLAYLYQFFIINDLYCIACVIILH